MIPTVPYPGVRLRLRLCFGLCQCLCLRLQVVVLYFSEKHLDMLHNETNGNCRYIQSQKAGIGTMVSRYSRMRKEPAP